MQNIIILGYKGKLGHIMANYLKGNNKVFEDSNFEISRLLSINFINQNKITCIINCIGSYKDEDLFFKSNFVIPYVISEKLSKIDALISQKILFIHISTIGVNAPYMKYNFKSLPLINSGKLKIKYNQYEFSKSCGEFVVMRNLSELNKISTIILQPSNIIFPNSSFLRNLKIFLYLFPFKVKQSISIPLTPIDYLLKYIEKAIDSDFKEKLIIKKLYKRQKISFLFKNSTFLSKIKINIPLKLLRKIIKLLPDNYILSSLKRRLILIFVL